ncbi:MAG: hypothetical protein ACFCD0_26640 [Gemmataceae bacterium]
MRYGIGLAWLLAWGVSVGTAAENKETLEKADEHLLKIAKFSSTDTQTLLEFVKKRTLTEHEKIEIGATIQNLGADSFRARTVATRKLISRGPVISRLLKEAITHSDLEISNRAKKCLDAIGEKRPPHNTPATVIRLLGRRAPLEATEILLHHVPYAENLDVIQETKTALVKIAKSNPKAREILKKNLNHFTSEVRAVAGFAYVLSSRKVDPTVVTQLRLDRSALVQMEVGKALAYSADKTGVQTVIQSLSGLDDLNALQAEDWLHQVGQGQSPPKLFVGKTKEERKAAQDVWAKWWSENQKKVPLSQLKLPVSTRGPTVVIFLDNNKVQEIDAGNRLGWKLENLGFPLDVELLDNGRVLLTEYENSRITERDESGKIVWWQKVDRPIAAQRLTNGHTFIVTDMALYEYDTKQQLVFTHSLPNQERILKATKRPNGDIVCLTEQARVVRLSASGRGVDIRDKFDVKHSKPLFGGKLYFTPAGRVLIPHNAENKVIEYDHKGNPVWELDIQGPVAAVRLPNGNTLVTTMGDNMTARPTVEVDRAGNLVWKYGYPSGRVTRALRR